MEPKRILEGDDSPLSSAVNVKRNRTELKVDWTRLERLQERFGVSELQSFGSPRKIAVLAANTIYSDDVIPASPSKNNGSLLTRHFASVPSSPLQSLHPFPTSQSEESLGLTGLNTHTRGKTLEFVLDDPLKSVLKTPTSSRTKKIHEYFAPTSTSTKSPLIPVQRLDAPWESLVLSPSQSPDLIEEIKRKNVKIRELEKALENVKSCSERDRDEFKASLEIWKTKCDTMQKRFADWAARGKHVLISSLSQLYEIKSRDSRRINAENNLSLANVVSNSIEQECWQTGFAFSEVQEKLSGLQREKVEIETRKKVVAKLVKAKDDESCPKDEYRMDILQEEEILKLRLSALKKEESDTMVHLDRLILERNVHIRNHRRIRDEDASRFNGHPVLNERYLLLEMIGRGGFSEVFKAFDLVQLETVAVKIHSLNEQWSEERKKQYVKLSSRECQIQKSLCHPHVVQLFDVFEYDATSFCTVLEYVDGCDLESHLKSVKTMPEKEARSLIIQVMQALKHMNLLEKPVIHYDLKPANILMRHGFVKVADFGLSKIVEPSVGRQPNVFSSRETELTSMGAGTYWYLPPEVFETGSVKISSKVDVWSLGCIFYEMVYGIKPFGNEMSQQTLMQKEMMMHDAFVDLSFPAKPATSEDCKRFIRKCLEYHREQRPDILTLSEDSYLQPLVPPRALLKKVLEDVKLSVF